MERIPTKPALPLSLRLLQSGFAFLGPLFPHYFSKLAYRFWLTPQRFNPPESEQQALRTADISTLVINDIPVRCYRWGEGPLVLFVHGWSGRGSQATHFIKPLVHKGFSVLSFDSPAHGATPGKQTNMLEISDVILALHRHFGDFHSAITHSFGGMILPYAIQRGLRVGRIASICPPAGLDVILANFQHQLAIPDKVIDLMLADLHKKFGTDLAEKISTVSNVSSLTVPGIVIHDENDDDIPWQSGKRIADAWPGASFILTHKLGHRRILRAGETVQAVIDFIAQT
jgi:pimeloyl-ACP methyl ester carboxylesterase